MPTCSGEFEVLLNNGNENLHTPKNKVRLHSAAKAG